MDCSPARTRNPSEWLETCPDFSRPMAEQLTDWILTWEPDLTESIKWNMLCFSGRKLVCGLSACKRHLGLMFFRATELPDPAKLFPSASNNTNILSIRITTLEGFNCDALRELLHAAVELDADPMVPAAPKVKRPQWPMPDFFKKDRPNRLAGIFHAAHETPTARSRRREKAESCPRPVRPPIHDAGRARLLPSRDQTGSFGSAGASPYRVKMRCPATARRFSSRRRLPTGRNARGIAAAGRDAKPAQGAEQADDRPKAQRPVPAEVHADPGRKDGCQRSKAIAAGVHNGCGRPASLAP